ncbi:MAG: SH3 domain-containing protein [Gammaproteobacteria bacterium]
MNSPIKYCLGFFLATMMAESFACGGVAHSFYRLKLETDRTVLERFLQTQACSGDLQFFPDLADAQVYTVLQHAAEAGVAMDVFERVLSRFHCVAKLADRPGYRKIVDYVGDEKMSALCAPEALARVYVVKASGGANLRASQSIDAAKVGAVQQGAVAVNDESEGDTSAQWIKVRTYAGEGYMHRSTLRTYL